MTLSEFQKAEGLTLVALAERLGMPITTVHGYLKEKRRPALDALGRIEAATEGRVTKADLRPDLAAHFGTAA